jgi:ribonucleotide reductase beta subunit family protein with ferritin-like domain
MNNSSDLHNLAQELNLLLTRSASITAELETRLKHDHPVEPICNPTNRRFTFFPIEYPTLYKSYKLQQGNHWTAEEIDFSRDCEDFKTLNPDVQRFIKHILAFFAASDGIVNFGLSRFINEIQIMEAQVMYRYQSMMEDTHGEVYSRMLQQIVENVKERDELFRAIETVPSIKRMARWALKWIESSESLAHRIVANAVVEGIFFSGAFAAIFWIKKHFNHNTEGSFMKGLTTSNAWIARDEGQHCVSACLIYDLLEYKLEHQEIYDIVDEAVEISKEFMHDALPVRLIGMNAEMMNQYIEYVADWILSMLIVPKRYNSPNPFSFMTELGLDSKTNFFEIRNDSYRKADQIDSSQKIEVNLDDEF